MISHVWKILRGEIIVSIFIGVIFLVLYGLYQWAQTPSQLTATSDASAQAALKRVEVVSAEILRRPSGNIYAVITLKNDNAFRVHNVEVSCNAFDAAGRRLRTQQEQFKRLRSHSLMKFQREKSFRSWELSDSIQCTVDAVRLSTKEKRPDDSR